MVDKSQRLSEVRGMGWSAEDALRLKSTVEGNPPELPMELQGEEVEESEEEKVARFKREIESQGATQTALEKGLQQRNNIDALAAAALIREEKIALQADGSFSPYDENQIKKRVEEWIALGVGENKPVKPAKLHPKTITQLTDVLVGKQQDPNTPAAKRTQEIKAVISNRAEEISSKLGPIAQNQPEENLQ